MTNPLFLPCPFCGSSTCERQWNGAVIYVQCPNCYATGPQFATFEPKDYYANNDALTAWNKRKDNNND